MRQSYAKRPGRFRVGDRVEVIQTGARGTVTKARPLFREQHQLGIRVAWDERPFAFSPETSIIACPTNVLRHLEAS